MHVWCVRVHRMCMCVCVGLSVRLNVSPIAIHPFTNSSSRKQIFWTITLHSIFVFFFGVMCLWWRCECGVCVVGPPTVWYSLTDGFVLWRIQTSSQYIVFGPFLAWMGGGVIDPHIYTVSFLLFAVAHSPTLYRLYCICTTLLLRWLISFSVLCIVFISYIHEYIRRASVYLYSLLTNFIWNFVVVHCSLQTRHYLFSSTILKAPPCVCVWCQVSSHILELPNILRVYALLSVRMAFIPFICFFFGSFIDNFNVVDRWSSYLTQHILSKFKWIRWWVFVFAVSEYYTAK